MIVKALLISGERSRRRGRRGRPRWDNLTRVRSPKKKGQSGKTTATSEAKQESVDGEDLLYGSTVGKE